MKDVIADVDKWVERGDDVVLATVIDVKRSAPRPPGAKLAVSVDGETVGAVSGGCVEGAVITEAIEVIEAGAPRVLEFGVADETAWRAGLSCGGRIRVFVERLD